MKKFVLSVAVLSLLAVSCGNDEKTSTPITTTTANQTETETPINESVIEVPTTSTTINSNTPTTRGTTSPTKPVSSGGNVGRISIPSIGVDRPIYEGIALPVLNKGPGHYPHSPKPCRSGNAAIAGHRTTYGAPFNKLDVLKDGDLVNISTPEGDCVYRYLRTEIVSPNNVTVVMPKDNDANRLTLTACHPKGSAAKRIVVTAELISVTQR